MHFLGFQFAVEQLNISTTTINVLLVFHCILDNEILAFVAERSEFLGQRVEPGVLRCLYTLVSFGIVVESSRAVNKLAKLFAGMLGVCPFIFPRIYEETN